MVIFLKKGVPKYQIRDQHEAGTNEEIVFEIETDESREKIQEVFAQSGLLRIQFNGGVYILHFEPGINKNEVFRQIASHDLPLRYLRDITYSSRRFFIQ